MPNELAEDLRHIFLRTQTVWPKLAGSNVLITGATGFVGTWLVDSFLWADRQLALGGRLFVLTRGSRLREGVELISGDIKGFPFPVPPIHYVIHAAVEHGSDAVATNLAGTRRVIEMAKARETRRILFTSSGAVYGEQPDELEKFEEAFRAPARLNTSYAQAKRACEEDLSTSGLDVVMGRLFTFVGPHLPLDKNFAIGNFIRDALRAGPIRVEGDGTPVRSYLYAADLAIWLWHLLAHGEPGRPYNVGSDCAVSILQLAQTVQRVCCVKSDICVGRSAMPGEKPKRYLPSIDRARTELKLEPWISLDDGIRRSFDWAQASMK